MDVCELIGYAIGKDGSLLNLRRTGKRKHETYAIRVENRGENLKLGDQIAVSGQEVSWTPKKHVGAINGGLRGKDFDVRLKMVQSPHAHGEYMEVV